MNFEEIVQKVINTKVKTSLSSSNMVRNSDIYYPRDYCLSSNTPSKVQATAKDFQPEEPKVKKAKPTLTWAIKISEPSKQTHKKKEKKRQQEKQNKK